MYIPERTHALSRTCTHPPSVFPEDGRNICVPTVDETDASIITLVVMFSDQPDCVEVSGAQSGMLNLCSSGNATVHVDTRNLFGSETETGKFDLVVDDQNTAVEYGKLAMRARV